MLSDRTSNYMQDTLFNRTFCDQDGNLAIAQKPNPPILIWAVAALLQTIVPEGNLHVALEVVAFGALFTWGWLELTQGINYFRRALGLGALVWAVASQLPWQSIA